MQPVTKHLTRCLVAGVVALLPVGGTIFTIVYFETLIAASWLKEQGFYFFGCGLLATALLVYAIGLAISTFIGRWLWRQFDKLVNGLPVMGRLYQTLKQIMGYGEGPDAMFRRVVLIPARDVQGDEIGLVTAEAKSIAGQDLLTVFLPGAPNPTTGRVIMVDANEVRSTSLRVNDALMSLVSVGAIPVDKNADDSASS